MGDDLRAAVLIDAQNMYRNARDAFFVPGVNDMCGNFWPHKLADLLVERVAGRWLDPTLLYTGVPSPTHQAAAAAAQQSRLEHHKAHGATIRSRPLNYVHVYPPWSVQFTTDAPRAQLGGRKEHFVSNDPMTFVSLSEIAERLGASRSTVRRWLEEAAIPAYVFGSGRNAALG